MHRSLVMLAFAACTIPVAACSAIQDAREPLGRADFGPVNCDPLGSDSPEFLVLVVGPLGRSEIYASIEPTSRTGATSAGSRRAIA
jgi:hypothetical protein